MFDVPGVEIRWGRDVREVVVVSDEANAAQERLRSSLRELVSKLSPEIKAALAGDIVLRLSGKGGGTYRVPTGSKHVEVSETVEVPAQPLIEVIGDAEAVQAVLDRKVNAREQFLAGGIRVRGDLRYLSDVALEMGLLKHPL